MVIVRNTVLNVPLPTLIRELDATQTEGQNAGKNYPGIFEIQGNTLRWCVSNNGRTRPQQLATLGASAYLMVLQRQP